MTTTHEPTVLVPGWYADPTERYSERYFDGKGWTERAKSGDAESKDVLPEDLSGFLAKPHGSPLSVEVAPPPPVVPSVPLAPLTESAKPSRRRLVIIGVAAIAAIGIGVAASSGGSGGSSASSTPASQAQTPQQAGTGYFDPATLEGSVQDSVNTKLAATNTAVTDVTCVASGGQHFRCLVTADDGSTLALDVVVAPDGQRWVSTAA